MHGRTLFKPIATLMLAAIAVLSTTSNANATAGQTTERVSLGQAGEQLSYYSEGGAVSDDGRYVAFTSVAPIVPSDTNGRPDVFVRDRVTGSVVRVSVDSDGNEANGDSWSDVVLSGDGRFTAFTSNASNLVAGDSNGVADVFLHDNATGATTRVSMFGSAGQGNNASYSPSITSDSRYVGFASTATNWIPGGYAAAYLFDRTTDRIEVASLTDAGQPNPYFVGGPVAITSDARFIAFSAYASSPYFCCPRPHVYLRDRVRGTTEGVDLNNQGDPREGYAPSISADGRYVAFVSNSDELVDGDTNGRQDVFVRDRASGITKLVDRTATDGVPSFGVNSGVISRDGHSVAFVSTSPDVVGVDTNGVDDLFLRDICNEATERVSVSSAGDGGDSYSGPAAMSADGRYVVFRSDSTNLAAGDTNETSDVFLRDRGSLDSGACPGALTDTDRIAIDADLSTPDIDSSVARCSICPNVFSIGINVSHADAAYTGYQWDLDWDSNILTLASVEEQTAATGFTLCAPPTYYYVAGRAYRAGNGAGCLSPSGSSSHFIGTTTILGFQCRTAGTTSVGLRDSRSSSYPTTTFASDGTQVTTTLLNAKVVCSPTVDTDGDGCADAKEYGSDHLLGGQRDFSNPWDFFDVPIPVVSPSRSDGTRDHLVSIGDAIAVLYYIGTVVGGGANANGVSYDSDLNQNNVADGREYDRTFGGDTLQPWRSGPPNGVVSLQDVIVELAQVGSNCS